MIRVKVLLIALLAIACASAGYATSGGGSFIYGGFAGFNQVGFSCDGAPTGTAPIGSAGPGPPATSDGATLTAEYMAGPPPTVEWRVVGGGTSVTGSTPMIGGGFGMPSSGGFMIYPCPPVKGATTITITGGFITAVSPPPPAVPPKTPPPKVKTACGLPLNDPTTGEPWDVDSGDRLDDPKVIIVKKIHDCLQKGQE